MYCNELALHQAAAVQNKPSPSWLWNPSSFVSSEKCIPQHPLKNSFSTKFLFKTRNLVIRFKLHRKLVGLSLTMLRIERTSSEQTVALLLCYQASGYLSCDTYWKGYLWIISVGLGTYIPAFQRLHPSTTRSLPQVSPVRCSTCNTKLTRTITVVLHLHSTVQPGFWFITSSNHYCSKVTAEWNINIKCPEVLTALWDGYTRGSQAAVQPHQGSCDHGVTLVLGTKEGDKALHPLHRHPSLFSSFYLWLSWWLEENYRVQQAHSCPRLWGQESTHDGCTHFVHMNSSTSVNDGSQSSRLSRGAVWINIRLHPYSSLKSD